MKRGDEKGVDGDDVSDHIFALKYFYKFVRYENTDRETCLTPDISGKYKVPSPTLSCLRLAAGPGVGPRIMRMIRGRVTQTWW
jgi:hypothetical protein